MKRLSPIALLYAILFAFLIIAPAFLDSQFGQKPLIKNGDVLDIVTSLILIPVYWLMFQLSPDQLPRKGLMILFMTLAGSWAAVRVCIFLLTQSGTYCQRREQVRFMS